jgi:hypothetical protein
VRAGQQPGDSISQDRSTFHNPLDNFGQSITVDSAENFYFITENLYLIKTPETNGQSCIEDLFPPEWKNKQLKGKKFNPNSKIDPTSEYGKEVFANSVIRPNTSNIDFSGFDPLLESSLHARCEWSGTFNHQSGNVPAAPDTP